MFLVTGEDPSLIDRLCSRLTRAGVAHRAVDASHAVADPGNLFAEAFESRAVGVIALEPLVWKEGPAPAAGDGRLLEAALRAGSAPGMSLLLLVTSRGDEDPGLRALRQRGVPYIVLRPPPVVDLLPAGIEAALRDHTVLVPAEVSAATEGALLVPALLDGVVRALRGEAPQGRVVDVPPAPLALVLEQAGAKVKPAGSLRTRLGRWFGQAIALLAEGAVRIEGIEPADPVGGDAQAPGGPAYRAAAPIS
jgi:hypothetical protein